MSKQIDFSRKISLSYGHFLSLVWAKSTVHGSWSGSARLELRQIVDKQLTGICLCKASRHPIQTDTNPNEAPNPKSTKEKKCIYIYIYDIRYMIYLCVSIDYIYIYKLSLGNLEFLRNIPSSSHFGPGFQLLWDDLSTCTAALRRHLDLPS